MNSQLESKVQLAIFSTSKGPRFDSHPVFFLSLHKPNSMTKDNAQIQINVGIYGTILSFYPLIDYSDANNSWSLDNFSVLG